MKDWQYILRNLSLLSQMGISLAAPLLLCLFFYAAGLTAIL